MYFLMHGFADVIAPNGIVVHTMQRGQYFGEIALLVPNTKRTGEGLGQGHLCRPPDKDR